MTVTAINSATKAKAPSHRLVLARLAAASSGVREARAAVTTASDHLGAEITEARRASVSWQVIAEAAQISINHAMSLVKVEPEKAVLPESSNEVALMSVLEYAGYAGVTAMTVYKRIRQGKLPTTENERGNIRVIVPA